MNANETNLSQRLMDQYISKIVWPYTTFNNEFTSYIFRLRKALLWHFLELLFHMIYNNFKTDNSKIESLRTDQWSHVFESTLSFFFLYVVFEIGSEYVFKENESNNH